MSERCLCPVLVGRDDQLARLEDALLSAKRGEGAIVVLGGEAGMGKTRLAMEAEDRARKLAMVVLRGACAEPDLSLPYLPFVEAVGNYLALANLDEIRPRLGSARRELALLFPQLEPDFNPVPSADPLQAKLRLFEALLTLLRLAAGERGLLLVIEDIHWADASTRELLDYLLRRLPGSRIALLATYRSDELYRRHPLVPILAAWRRSDSVDIVEVKGLDPNGVGRMVSSILGGEPVLPEFRDFLYQRSEGNPFVVEEIIKAALDEGDISRNGGSWQRKPLDRFALPPNVRDMILLRLNRLTEVQANLLRAASVLGPCFDYRTLVDLSGEDEDRVQEALHACVQQQLLDEDGSARYCFRHSLTREAIYHDLIAPRRERLHAQAADILRKDPSTPPIDLAHHLMAANLWKEAVPIALQAAADAECRRAYREAAQLYERTLPHLQDETLRARAICMLGQALYSAMDTGRAVPYLEEGIKLLEGNRSSKEAAHFRLPLGRAYWLRAEPERAEAEYERARKLLEEDGPSEDLAVAYVRLAGMRNFNFEYPKSLKLARRAEEIAIAANADGPRAWAYNFIGSSLCNLGQVDEGLAYLDRSYEEAIARGLDWIALNALYNSIHQRISLFRLDEARVGIQHILDMGEQYRRDYLQTQARLHWHLGQLEQARLLLEESRVLDEQSGELLQLNRSALSLAYVYARLNRPEDARRVMPPVDWARQREDAVVTAGIALDIALSFDDRAELGPLIERTWNLLDHPGRVGGEDWIFDALMDSLLALGQREQAERLIQVEQARGIEQANPYWLRSQGRLALDEGRLDEAVGYLDRAASFLRERGAKAEEWVSRRLLASAKLRAGNNAGAEADLRLVLTESRKGPSPFDAEAAERALAEMGVVVESAGDELSRAAAVARDVDLRVVTERVVTVMFVDVRGYTALARRQAPEETADAISTLYRWCRQEVERHRGIVDKYWGDAIIALFNAAYESLDHTRQALQAALAIRDRASLAGLPVGIGIAVGPAVVGRLTEGSNFTALGETTNLASRLQGAAGPGEILLTEDAYRRTRAWLEARELSAQPEQLDLKGIDEPVSAYRLAAERVGGGQRR